MVRRNVINENIPHTMGEWKTTGGKREGILLFRLIFTRVFPALTREFNRIVCVNNGLAIVGHQANKGRVPFVNDLGERC